VFNRKRGKPTGAEILARKKKNLERKKDVHMFGRREKKKGVDLMTV